MSEEFLIGCPVYKRAWILPTWFEHVEKAAANAGVEPVYAFVVDERDEETIEVISAHKGAGYAFNVAEPVEHEDTRNWNPVRYKWMVTLRNELLGVVRLVEPSLFLSLDSDILLHPDAIKNLMETIESCDAVGGRAYMTMMDTRCPSWGRVRSDGSLFRQDSEGVFPAEVIMAMKLMKPTAYNVDYEYSIMGEDIGWSQACKRAGLKLMWDGRVINKHVMAEGCLHTLDRRVGF